MQVIELPLFHSSLNRSANVNSNTLLLQVIKFPLFFLCLNRILRFQYSTLLPLPRDIFKVICCFSYPCNSNCYFCRSRCQPGLHFQPSILLGFFHSTDIHSHGLVCLSFIQSAEEGQSFESLFK